MSSYPGETPTTPETNTTTPADYPPPPADIPLPSAFISLPPTYSSLQLVYSTLAPDDSPPPLDVSPPPPANYPPPPDDSPPPPGDSPPPPANYPPPPDDSPPPPANYPPPPQANTSASPPPPSSGSSPSPPASPSLTPPPPSISTGLIVGIVIGGVLILVVLGLIFVCFRKRKRRNHDSPPHGSKDDPHGLPPQHLQHNAHQPESHVVTMLPKPSHARSPRSPMHPTTIPTPPPPLMSSSEDSGSNYTGGENQRTPPSPGMALGFSRSTFTNEELTRATDGFSKANLLGQGGFGYVHKGVLPNGKEVAVKQLKAGSGQGESEFQAEVEIISRVHHRHLVTLLGYCIDGLQRMLVYEFVPNNTLEFHLHGSGRPTMDWPTRLKIALGAAKGLAYLHEDCHPKIIHRDIKATNILLDSNFEAKVADFGLAKFISDADTHISTRVKGTFGYLAPEYASSGKLTAKSDVFSFGVILLELITGRRSVSQPFTHDSLVDWARPLLKRTLEEGNFDTLVDQRLEKDYNHNEMVRMVACAASCVSHSARRRPQMSQVVRALERDVSLSDLNVEIRPGQSTAYSSHGSSEYDMNQYNEDLKKFRKMALGSQEYGSSTHSQPSSGSSSVAAQSTKEIEIGDAKKDG